MIFFFGEGRLGNQIFQYAFIKNFLKRRELLVTCNFKEILLMFDVEDRIINFKNKYLGIYCRKILAIILQCLGKIRVISSIYVPREKIGFYDRSTTKYVHKKGLLNITYIYPDYFQSEEYFDQSNIKELSIKKLYLEEAREFLRKLPKGEKIFVHIRRGDYKKFKVLGKVGACLPESYYKNLIVMLSEKYKNNVIFIFLSDDREYVRSNYGWVKNKVISEESVYVDFAIMTLCSGGILSNSSLSWWGGYLAEDRGEMYAPKYWLGFKSKIEIARKGSPSYAKLEEVKV